MDGWKTIFLLGGPIFRGELLVLGRVLSLKLTTEAPENRPKPKRKGKFYFSWATVVLRSVLSLKLK